MGRSTAVAFASRGPPRQETLRPSSSEASPNVAVSGQIALLLDPQANSGISPPTNADAIINSSEFMASVFARSSGSAKDGMSSSFYFISSLDDIRCRSYATGAKIGCGQVACLIVPHKFPLAFDWQRER